MISYALNHRELKFFDVAKSVSKTSDYHGVHVGCVITYGKHILAVASNSEKTHTLQQIYNKFRDFDPEFSSNKLHAEVKALSLVKNLNFRIGLNWSNVCIYVYRELKNGKPAISKPCNSCSNLIKDLNIKTIYYIDEKGRKVKEKL